ncbi:MAG: cation:dicarboxylase symporter family transporter [Gemmatimonadales bacterium]|nr:cation:dicarboxylase symporter family transporter [Gemmatimonadales bacterium]NIN12886.1 cation:dicarboxylase symporter family transporter [Gemmatimonadales bacterium]NIR00173.1 cation:dicarboxylase symporter family transporter [Gemmatimonadales bacterium]NIS65966.1 cation:dicarboxylase symporter family transporter [Gemmatimonadales bacterium]
MKLYTAVALGLIGGLLLGLVAAVSGSPLLIGIAEGIEPLGTAFVNLLKMVVIPLVAAVIFVGVGSLGDLRQLGRIGIITLFFFAATAVVSVLLGMGIMRLVLPLASEAAARAVEAAPAEAPPLPGIVEFLLSLIPSNPFQVAAEGALLPLIVFTILVAAAAGALPSEQRDQLLSLANSVAAALIKLVHWILWAAPVGVFALAAPITARAGWAMLQSLAAFILAVIAGLVVFIVIVYLPAVRLLGRMPSWHFLKGSASPLLIALTTASSAATLPAMLESAEAELRLSRPVTSFVIPLGAAIGRGGTALFQGAGVVFLAWLYGVPIPASAVGGAVLATFVVSFTVAGIPAGGVVSLAPALVTVGIPLDGLGVLLGVDRIPDMARTATNVGGVLAAGVVVDRLAVRPRPSARSHDSAAEPSAHS